MKPQIRGHPLLAGPWTPATEKHHTRLCREWRQRQIPGMVTKMERGEVTVNGEYMTFAFLLEEKL